MPDPTAILTKTQVEGPGTTDTTVFIRQWFTRLDDGSQDTFLSEVDIASDGPAILGILEADTGEVYA